MTLNNGKVFTSKYVGTGPSSYEKRIYRTAVSQGLRNTALVSKERLNCIPATNHKTSGHYSCLLSKRAFKCPDFPKLLTIQVEKVIQSACTRPVSQKFHRQFDLTQQYAYVTAIA